MTRLIHTDPTLPVEERDRIFREKLAALTDVELAEILESGGTFRAPNPHYVLEAARRLRGKACK